jgi:hypothetical protein
MAPDVSDVMARRMLGLVALALAPSEAWAGTCALCRQSLERGSPGLIAGFYWSIVLIAGVPLIVLGVAGTLAWRQAGLRRRGMGHR